MMLKYKKLDRADKVAAWRLCMGCGACVYACPNDAVSLVDIVDVGIRPRVDEAKCQQCHDCIKACPGIGLEHGLFPEGAIDELKQAWGPVLQLWEGYAADQQIRYAGSSGGVATALALHAIESGIAGGVLHIGIDKDEPIKNIPVYSKTREELLACTGSRYAPAAPCQAFSIIKEQNGKSIFIGKPCDVAALSKARKLDSELDSKVALTISIFCAGTPTAQGTLAILDRMGVGSVDELESFRYRGNGWPGMTTAIEKNGKDHQMTYGQAWGDILTKHGQFRCRLCPDSTGEFADIACGDPWYREVNDDPGRSLVLVRTIAGREFINRTLDSGIAALDIAASDVLPRSQKALYGRDVQLFGRLLALKVMMIPQPEYKGFFLYEKWRKTSMKVKLKSVLGTMKRILTRQWFKTFKY